MHEIASVELSYVVEAVGATLSVLKGLGAARAPTCTPFEQESL